MPRPKREENEEIIPEAPAEAAAPEAVVVEEELVPFSAIIDGESRTILAKDHDDFLVRVARMREAKS